MIAALFRRRAPAAPTDCCGRCRAFDNDPARIEAAMPLVRSLGSLYSSVRDDDGICARHDRYIRASAVCGDFAARLP